MKKIFIYDATLRDGSHAIKHQLDLELIDEYTKKAESIKIPALEIGHGNGLGASSIHLGQSLHSDEEMLKVARANLKYTKLAVLAIPGYATIERDIKPAIDLGVDIFRIASHCTESNVTLKHIEFCKKNNKETYGVLMMAHMTPLENLCEEAKKIMGSGADGIIIMDSSGTFLSEDVSLMISKLKNTVNGKIGFHAHNNFSMAITNSIAAIKEGADIIDATLRGFGAGAGNTQLEVLIGVLKKMNIETNVDLFKTLDFADWFSQTNPIIKSENVISALSGVFSGFIPHVKKISDFYNIDSKKLIMEIGKRKLIAGQEDLIVSIAKDLSLTKK